MLSFSEKTTAKQIEYPLGSLASNKSISTFQHVSAFFFYNNSIKFTRNNIAKHSLNWHSSNFGRYLLRNMDTDSESTQDDFMPVLLQWSS